MAARLRRLLLGFAMLAAGALAQPGRPLDLRLPSVKEGTVASIRLIDSGSASALAPRSGSRQVGTQSSLDQGPLVGAVVYLQGDPGTGEREWRFGAAGTPEMRPYLSPTSHEVIVTMDDGERRTFRPPHPERFRVGQRVTVSSGELEPLEERKGGA